MTKIVETVMSKEKNVYHVNSQMSVFNKHAKSVATQYTEIRTFIEHFPHMK